MFVDHIDLKAEKAEKKIERMIMQKNLIQWADYVQH